MRDFLSSPIWQFVGAMLAFVAIAISIAVYLKQRESKSLSYAIISLTPLLNIRDDIRGRVKILYDDKVVQDVHLAIIELFNSGSVPIVSDDYEHPIVFAFGLDATILSAEVVETSPIQFPASMELEGSDVTFDRTLLNKGDSVTFKVLITNFGGEVSVKGRVRGVRQITRSVPVRNRRTFRQEVKVNTWLASVPFMVGTAFVVWGVGEYLVLGLSTITGSLVAWVYLTWRDYQTFRRKAS